MWMALLIKPGSRIQAYRINYKNGVTVPMADRISVEPRVGCARCVHGRRELPCVRPHLSKYSLLLKQNKHAVRNWFEQDCSSHTYGMIQQVPRKTERITDHERIIRGPDR